MTRRLLQILRDIKLLRDGKFHQIWEVEQLRKVVEHLAIDCVFDVGANYGQYAGLLRSHVGYRGWIISFEPDPTAAAHLRKITLSDPRWIVEELAISDRSGTQPFHVMADSEFSSLSSPAMEQDKIFESFNVVRGTVDVRTETLTSVFERLRPELGFERPFLKLDTQGYDTRIVAAARETMARFVGLQSELSVRRIYDDSRDFRDALDLYGSAGFVLTAFVPNNAGHFPVLVETDCIMIRADVAANLQARLDRQRTAAEPAIVTTPSRSP